MTQTTYYKFKDGTVVETLREATELMKFHGPFTKVDSYKPSDKMVHKDSIWY